MSLKDGFDKCAFLVGIPKAGKSTMCRNLALDWCERGGYLLAHDPTRSWAVPHYDSWAAYVAASGGGEHPIRAAGFTCEWSEMVAGIIKLGYAVNAEKNVTVPMLVVADETSGINSSGRTHLGAQDNVLLGQRRHLGVAIALNLQRVTGLPEPAWGLATDVFVFRLAQEKDARLVEGYASLPEGMLQPALELEQGACLHVESGFGVRGFSDARLWVLE